MKKILIILILLSSLFCALQNMKLIGSGNGLLVGTAHEIQLSITNGPSQWILTPKGVQSLAISVNLISNSAAIEFTTVPVSEVDSTALIFQWPSGFVTTNTTDGLLSMVSAFRINSSNTVATLSARAQ